MNNPSWFPAPQNADLVTAFIIWFSRLEFAMKQTQAYSVVTIRGLEPNWNALRNYFQITQIQLPNNLLPSLTYLRHDPPRKEMTIGNWQAINQNNNDFLFLIDCLKTVRNNLFHGSKQTGQPLLSSQRDALIIQHCLTIMIELQNSLPQGMAQYLV